MIKKLEVEINRLVRKAIELDDNDAECHRIMCRISLLQRQYEKSEYHLGRALELTPNDPRLVVQRGINSTYLGEAQAALPWIEQAMRIDPFSASHYETDWVRALYASGRPGRPTLSCSVRCGTTTTVTCGSRLAASK